jgi:hypothetical protein
MPSVADFGPNDIFLALWLPPIKMKRLLLEMIMVHFRVLVATYYLYY